MWTTEHHIGNLDLIAAMRMLCGVFRKKNSNLGEGGETMTTLLPRKNCIPKGSFTYYVSQNNDFLDPLPLLLQIFIENNFFKLSYHKISHPLLPKNAE